MSNAIAAPRTELSPYAPRIVTMNISPEKIGDLIGPKGKTIRGIQDETGAEITVDDSGLVTIAAVGGEAMERAKQMVQALTAEPIVGETYEGTVKSTTAFGAFIEIMPGTEALLHISEMRWGRTDKTEDVVKRGDRVRVKLIDRDERGRLRLSMKALQPKPEGVDEGNGNRPPADRASGGERGVRRSSASRRPTNGFLARIIPPPRVSDGKGGRSSARHLLAAASSVVQSTADESALRSTTLPNGLIVVSELMPGVRSVALGAWVRAASLHERREAMGVSHLLEHMVFKGTANRSARDIALALEGLGGSLDAYTAREHTAYQARALDANLRDAADVLVDLVYRPLLRASDLKLERQVVLEEISMVEDTPDDLVFELHNEALWGPHPYGYSILGTRDSVSSAGRIGSPGGPRPHLPSRANHSGGGWQRGS